MKKIIWALILITCQVPLFAATNVVYGEDNRKDLFATNNAPHLTLARSTAGMVPIGKFIKSAQTGFFDIAGAKTLEQNQNVCASEAFAQQLAAPSCSGFLVGEDILVTAGHCYKSFDTPENVCKNFAWIFDYHMKSASHDPTKNIPITNIYLCQKVLSAELGQTLDFSIIKLDRKVVGRRPLKFRTSGTISDKTSLVVIGHPSGLPTKISDGGSVTKNSESTRFSTNLDTFHGNSGSAVFDASTGLLEGILIMGKNDYRLSIPGNPQSCVVVNKCDNQGNNCAAGPDAGPVAFGEIVLRIDAIKTQLQMALASK